MGITRLLLAGLVVVTVLALIFVGIRALIGSLSADGQSPGASPAATGSAEQSQSAPPQSAGTVPTVFIECLADRCPVFVRIPGGDVLTDRDLARGEQASYFDAEVDVVLGDAATVRVLVNGEERAKGDEGERQTFTAERTPASPS